MCETIVEKEVGGCGRRGGDGKRLVFGKREGVGRGGEEGR